MRNVVRTIVVIILSPIIIAFLILVGFFVKGEILRLSGYYVGEGTMFGEQVADHIIAESLPASDCKKIRFSFPSYPTVGIVQSACLYQLALKKRDPEVCTLLLPSEYGMNCIGDVVRDARRDHYCVIDGPHTLT